MFLRNEFLIRLFSMELQSLKLALSLFRVDIYRNVTLGDA